MDALWLVPSGLVVVGAPFVVRALARTRLEARRTTAAAQALRRDFDAAALALGDAGRRFRVAFREFEHRRGGLPPPG